MFKGIYTALVTPFKNDSVDYKKYKELVEFQIDNKVDGIVVAGTTGEGSSLTNEEFEKLITTASEYNDKINVIINIGSNNYEHIMERLNIANKYPNDGLLMVPPYYSRTNQNGLIELFEDIANKAKTPIVLYEIPARTGMSITLETVEHLAKHPNIQGIKVANDNSEYIAKVGMLASDNFQILGGNDDLFLLTLISKGSGIISAFSNVKPEYFVKTYALFTENKINEAMK